MLAKEESIRPHWMRFHFDSQMNGFSMDPRVSSTSIVLNFHLIDRL